MFVFVVVENKKGNISYLHQIWALSNEEAVAENVMSDWPPCPAQPVDISIVIPWLSDSGDFSVRQTQRIIDRQSIRGHFINIEITEDISDLSECLHQTSWFMYLLCLFRVSLKTETEKKETDWERGMSLHLKLFPFCYDIASFQLIQSITFRLPASVIDGKLELSMRNVPVRNFLLARK